MTKTIHAFFDGKVFRPEDAVDLKINKRYRLKIEPLWNEELIEGVENDPAFDLASNHNHYLYKE